MYAAQMRPPPVTCKMCVPNEHFYVLEDFRKHLRIKHQMRHPSQDQIRQFENFPNAVTYLNRGPPSVRRRPTHQTNSNPAPAVDNNEGQNGNQPATNVTNNTTDPNGNLPAPNAPPSANQPAPEAVDNAIFNANLDTKIRDIVTEHISSELRNRLPLLANEIKSRINNAVQHVVPHMVNDTMLRFVEQFTDSSQQMSFEEEEEEAEPNYGENVTMLPAIKHSIEEVPTQRSFVSDGLHVRVTFSNNLCQTQTIVPSVDDVVKPTSLDKTPEEMDITASDDELLTVSPTLLDVVPTKVFICHCLWIGFLFS